MRTALIRPRRAAKGECDLAFDDLAAHADGILAIVLPPRRPDDPAFRERLGALARLFGDRCYLAGTMLFRGDDARRLAQLDNLAAEMKVGFVATNDVHYHRPERRALQDVTTADVLGWLDRYDPAGKATSLSIRTYEGTLTIAGVGPDGETEIDLVRRAAAEGIFVSPGSVFFPDRHSARPCMRVNIAYASDERFLRLFQTG